MEETFQIVLGGNGSRSFLTFDATTDDKNGFREKMLYDMKERISLTATVDVKLIIVTCRLYSSVTEPAPNDSI